jgi:uncharacterized protein (DUF1330 family)
MQGSKRWPHHISLLALAVVCTLPLNFTRTVAQEQERPAYVLVERTETTGPESIQDQYAKLARDILPKYGAHYLARSRNNAQFEGEGQTPCCIAILQFPNLESVQRWYNSPENRSAAEIRRSGAKFRIIAVEGLPDQR